jgi:hypothetical protein
MSDATILVLVGLCLGWMSIAFIALCLSLGE